MSAKKSFIILQRIVFLWFSLKFLKNAFYKWDGYSYYIRFADFLPDLSLAFILWSILGIIWGSGLWLIIYSVPKLSQKSLKTIRFEQMILWVIVTLLAERVTIILVERFLFVDVSLSLLNYFLIGGVLAVPIVWLLRNHAEKLIYQLDTRLTPLVWLFALLLIVAVPFSIFKKETPRIDVSHSRQQLEAPLDNKRPNIILVTLDGLYARDMHVYGNKLPTTPFISEWAKDAVVFDRAYSASNWTTPTTMSMMTGQRPWTHKVWYFATYHPVESYEENFPRVLRDYGYNVYAFVQNGHAHPETLGVGDAFSIKDKADTFFVVPDGWNWFYRRAEFFVWRLINRAVVTEWVLSHPINRIFSILPNDTDTTHVPVEIVYNRFLNYISQAYQNRNSDNQGQAGNGTHQPFFAWLHVEPPHYPYLPPKPYMGMFGDAERFNTRNKQQRSNLLEGKYKPERQSEVDILKKRYYEFIVYTDQQVKLLLLRLAEIIDMSNTIIILSADHGTSFSHNYQAHAGQHLYEPIVHIPLIIKMPGKTRGGVIDMPVEQTDIAPTILEMADIPVPTWMEGRSLLTLIKGKPLEPRPVFSMKLQTNRLFGYPITNGTIAVWDGDYKLIYYLSETRSEEDKKRLLFDMRSDPGETQDLSQQKTEITQKLMRLINDNLFRVNAKIKESTEGQALP